MTRRGGVLVVSNRVDIFCILSYAWELKFLDDYEVMLNTRSIVSNLVFNRKESFQI